MTAPLSREEWTRAYYARVAERARHKGFKGFLKRVRTNTVAKLGALGLAVAVPAMATPGDWSSYTDEPEATVEPMPFEMAGESFPGSAFYYLADEPFEPLPAEALIHSDAELPTTTTGTSALAAARPLVAIGSGLDHGRALQCLTQAIYYEAASESDAGQRAVAQVVLNRVAHPTYPNTVCGVVYQGSERRTGCQFTFTCDGSLARKPARVFWDRAERVARAALAGAVYTPVGLATHYHTVQVHPYWADSLDRIGSIGAHIFYRWRGAAGQPSAFRFAYVGGEPVAAPRANSIGDDLPLDPVAVARAYEASLTTAAPAAVSAVRPAAANAYVNDAKALEDFGRFNGDRLPTSGTVKPEYAQSGQWIERN